MITSDKIFKLVETFERVLPYAKHACALRMTEAVVSNKHAEYRCGTTHCHAGWYALADKWDLKSPYLKRYYSYSDGGNAMARDLGLLGVGHLIKWAEDNPEIWGNKYAYNMFVFADAFNYKGKLTLQKIVDHWGEVGMRLLLEELYQGVYR